MRSRKASRCARLAQRRARKMPLPSDAIRARMEGLFLFTPRHWPGGLDGDSPEWQIAATVELTRYAQSAGRSVLTSPAATIGRQWLRDRFALPPEQERERFMLFRSFGESAGAFGPEALVTMSAAFEAACKELRHAGREVVTEIVARRIITAARFGERDPFHLRVAALGKTD